MGAPELPSDPGDDELNSETYQINHAPVPSDESDNESNDAYEGYQPLPMGDNPEDAVELDRIQSGNPRIMADLESPEAEQPNADSNFPYVESVDVEIERQVWSEPRPVELQIVMDSSRTEQILTAMANVSLPNASVPDWAQGVPEERWKEELLQRIRQRKV